MCAEKPVLFLFFFPSILHPLSMFLFLVKKTSRITIIVKYTIAKK